jgi:hypothetical protein
MKLSQTHLLGLICLSIILTLTASGCTQPQEPSTTKPKTELEGFQEKFGSVIIKGYTEIGSIPLEGRTLSLDARELRDATTNEKVKGLVVEIDPKERFSTRKRSFVEYEEIESLSRGLEFISKIDKSVTPLSNFEATYRTKGDLEVTVFNDSTGKLAVAVSVGGIAKETAFGELDLLNELNALIKKAKDTLDSLK